RIQMCRDAAVYLPELRAAVESAERSLGGTLPYSLSQTIYPPAAFSAEGRALQESCLTDTRMAQVAIGALSVGYLDFLQRLGIRPDMVAGHSYGEYVALHAAGVFDRQALLLLSEVRGRAMAKAPPGAMAAIAADDEQIAAVLSRHPDVVLANRNTEQQA